MAYVKDDMVVIGGNYRYDGTNEERNMEGGDMLYRLQINQEKGRRMITMRNMMSNPANTLVVSRIPVTIRCIMSTCIVPCTFLACAYLIIL